MAHAQQTGFIRLMRDIVFPSNGTVLEIGSYEVNEKGNLRSIFSGAAIPGRFWSKGRVSMSSHLGMKLILRRTASM